MAPRSLQSLCRLVRRELWLSVLKRETQIRQVSYPVETRTEPCGAILTLMLRELVFTLSIYLITIRLKDLGSVPMFSLASTGKVEARSATVISQQAPTQVFGTV